MDEENKDWFEVYWRKGFRGENCKCRTEGRWIWGNIRFKDEVWNGKDENKGRRNGKKINKLFWKWRITRGKKNLKDRGN